ncbi:MAG: TIGR04076 family protein [Pontixanthobacter sp.]
MPDKNHKDLANASGYPLFDLRVEVLEPEAGKRFICKHVAGDYFTVTEDDLITMGDGVRFSMYSLAALIPFLSAKQRDLHANDWMMTDDIIACTDPHCAGRFRITRETRRIHSHSENSAVPL